MDNLVRNLCRAYTVGDWSDLFDEGDWEAMGIKDEDTLMSSEGDKIIADFVEEHTGVKNPEQHDGPLNPDLCKDCEWNINNVNPGFKQRLGCYHTSEKENLTNRTP